MEKATLQLYFLLILLTGTFILTFFIFSPFFYALILAAVFAVVFQSLHQKILNYVRGQQGLAAFITAIVIAVFILTPLVFLGMQIFQEAMQLYSYFTDNGEGGLLDNFRKFFPALPEFSINVNQYLKQGVEWLLQNLGAIFSNLAKMIVSFFVFFIVLYYLLKDGGRLKAAIIAISPLADADDEIIFTKLERAINSVIKGSLLIALIQGALTAAGFIIFGVPNAVLWGTVAAIAALIPGIGTALILIPAIIFLFLSGEIFPAFGLTIWGIAAVGLIDNFLLPKLVSRGMRLHSLLVLLSVLGGIEFFGPIGFLLGPLTLSFLFVLLNIYSNLVKIK